MISLAVENLPMGTTVPDLVALFKPYGWVAGVNLRAAQNGADGSVDLAWGGDVAVQHLHGVEYRGRVLTVRGLTPFRDDRLATDSLIASEVGLN